jgi:hypothetical protein
MWNQTTFPLFLYCSCPLHTPPPGINKLFLSTQALVFALNKLKQVNGPYHEHSYVWVRAPNDASFTLSLHITPLRLRLSLSHRTHPQTRNSTPSFLLNWRAAHRHLSHPTLTSSSSCHEFILWQQTFSPQKTCFSRLFFLGFLLIPVHRLVPKHNCVDFLYNPEKTYS